MVLVLVVSAPFLRLQSSFTTDEGAYAFQVRALNQGSWALHQATDGIDPDGRWFGIVNGTHTARGNFPYVSHPAFVTVEHWLTVALGRQVGLHLLAVAGVVGTAVAAWLLAGLIDDRLRPWAFWAAATSPVLVNGTIVWAHTVSAAAAGLALVGAAGMVRRGVRPANAALTAGAVVAGVLARSEGLLFAGALAAVVGVTLVASSRPVRGRLRIVSAAAASGVVAGPALVAAVAEHRWTAAIIGSSPVVRGIRQTQGSWLGGRVAGGWHDLLSPHAYDQVAGLLGAVALALFVFAAVKLRRGGGKAGVAAWCGAGLALLAVRTALRPAETVTGLFAAWPLAAAGLLVWRRRRASAVEHLVLATSAVFAVMVLATTYREGGGQEWGGRFFFPMVVPVAVVAVAAIRATVAEIADASRRRLLVRTLVALAVGPSLLGLVVVGTLRTRTDRVVADVVAAHAPVVMTDSPALPRAAWRADGIAWLLVPPADAPLVLDRLHGAGFDRVAVVGSRELRSAASARMGTGSAAVVEPEPPAPALRRAGYSLTVLRP